MTPAELTALEAELRAAMKDVTPGPWAVYDGCSWRRIGIAHGRRDDCAVLAPTKASDGHPDLTCSRGNDREANLNWIARCSPDNIAALLDAIADLRRKLDEANAAGKCPFDLAIEHQEAGKALRAELETVKAGAQLRLNRLIEANDALEASLARAAQLEAENGRLREALESIRLYANDTLSGRADGGPDDRAWQREAVVECRNRARAALTGREG